MKIKERVFYFDYIRSIAITLVIIGHFRHFFLPNYSGETPIIYFISSFGHFGVIIFFGLSGILCSNRLKKIYTWSDVYKFIRLRVIRIYLVFPIALIITYFFDALGRSLNLYDGISEYQIISQMSNPDERMTIMIFLGNLFSLQTFHFSFFGSNGPLWSLSYEVWFYILGPLLKKSKKSIILLLPIAFIDLKFIMFFIFWYNIPKLIELNINYFIFFISSLIFVYFHIERYIYLDIIYILYFIIGFNFFRKFEFKKISLVEFISKISYSLYIYHYPILLFLTFYLYSNSIKEMNFIQSITISFLVLLICYILYQLFENSSFSNKLLNKLRKE